MRYLIVLRAIYLTAYYLVLSKQPSPSYLLSVLIAATSGTLLTLFVFFQLIFGDPDTKSRFPFESLLAHGLSYEEWRTATVVKKKMDKIQIVASGKESFSEDVYLGLLLVLSFSGLVEYRVETPEELSDRVFGKLPVEDEVVTTHQVNRSGVEPEVTTTERQISQEEATLFANIKQNHLDATRESHFQGTTISRLVFDGVNFVFKRKKLGPKRPAKTNAFMKAFGITTT